MIERFFAYSDLVSLTPNQVVQNLRLLIRQDADFYLRSMNFFTTSGAVAGRFRRADSSWFSGQDFAHLSGLMDTTGSAKPWPIEPQIRYPASSAFVYDLQDLGGAGDAAIFPLLIGVERYQDGALPAPALPAKYVEQDFTIIVQQTMSGLGTQVLSIPVQCRTGDAFIIRQLTVCFDPAIGGVSTGMFFRLRDEHGRQFSSDTPVPGANVTTGGWLPVRLLFALQGQTAPGLVFPEMVIPANGTYSLDLWNRTEAGPFGVELGFNGVRAVEATSA